MTDGTGLLTAGETASLLGVSPAAVRLSVREGRLAAYRLGDGPRAHLRIPWRSVADYLGVDDLDELLELARARHADAVAAASAAPMRDAIGFLLAFRDRDGGRMREALAPYRFGAEGRRFVCSLATVCGLERDPDEFDRLLSELAVEGAGRGDDGQA